MSKTNKILLPIFAALFLGAFIFWGSISRQPAMVSSISSNIRKMLGLSGNNIVSEKGPRLQWITPSHQQLMPPLTFNSQAVAAPSLNLKQQPNPYNPPVAPQYFSASSYPSLYQIYISLQWNNTPDNEDGYVVERSLNGVNFFPIANLPADAFYFLDASIQGNVTYYYRIKAFNNAGANYSTTQTVLAPPYPPNAPIPPSNLTITGLNSTKVSISWIDNSTNETAFYVMRGDTPWGYSTVLYFLSPHKGTGRMTAVDSTIVPNTHYWYIIVADTSSFATAESDTVDVIVPVGSNSSPTPPAAPAFFEAYGNALMPPGVARILLIWQNVANETGYRVERSVNNSSNFIEIGQAQGVPPIAYYLDGSLTPNTDYFYRVKAYNQWGSSYSPIIQVHNL
jgi:hypothetical protein